MATNYSRLFGKEWKQVKPTYTGHECNKLCEINNDIWCGGDDRITVYNKQCKRLKTIKHPRLRDIRAITLYNDLVIVACRDAGLHSLTREGQYITQVIEGCFSDVCVQGDYLYGLEWDEDKLIVFKYSDEWEKMMEVSLHYQDGSSFDRLCVTQNTICVSSFFDQRIYTYNTEGQLLHEVTNDNEVLLCDVDEEGNSLVVDCDEQALYVDHKNKWCPLTLTGGNQLERPDHALLDTDGNFWVGTHIYKLVKYAVIA